MTEYFQSIIIPAQAWLDPNISALVRSTGESMIRRIILHKTGYMGPMQFEPRESVWTDPEGKVHPVIELYGTWEDE